MTARKAPKPEVRWNQSSFEALRATWSAERIVEDEKRLKEIFDLAAEVPLLAQALDWANSHDVRFFIDRTAVDCGAYYSRNTGVLAITEKTAQNIKQNTKYAVEAITHEIRHAWQDYYGLANSASFGSFSESFIKTALFEADAGAFGKRAADQYSAAVLRKQGAEISDALQTSLANESADLMEKFLSWFSKPSYLQYYGTRASKSFGRIWGVFRTNDTKPNESPPDRGPEIGSGTGLGDGINTANIQDVLRLGKGFSGTHNYLVALPPDTLPKKILRPSLANIFWGAADNDQKKLTAEIRKAFLRRKLTDWVPQRLPQ